MIPPERDAAFVAQMEAVLDRAGGRPPNEEPYDADRPVVCFDEKPYQLLGHVREPLPPGPGRTRRTDYEYERRGTANLFVFYEPLRAFRHAEVRERRRAAEFADMMRLLVDELYPGAPVVRVVLDNLSTHTAASLYKRFPAVEARRIARRLSFTYTPPHGSWLNMVEVENAAVGVQCLRRRIGSVEELASEVAAWASARNAVGVGTDWQFTTDDARVKLKRLYPTDET